VFLNASLPPQRGHGSSWLILIVSKASFVPTGRGTGDIEYAAQDFCVKLALRDTTYKAHIGPLRVAKKVIQRCRSKPIGGPSSSNVLFSSLRISSASRAADRLARCSLSSKRVDHACRAPPSALGHQQTFAVQKLMSA
jgi:hypothetical protein